MSSPTPEEARRQFLLRVLRVGAASAGTIGLGAYLSGRSYRPGEGTIGGVGRDHAVPAIASLPEMVVAQGGTPAARVQKALIDIGGMSRFVTSADTVVIKPNIAWDRSPEEAATTNPEVVAEIVRLCRAAGARSVIVTDVSCNDAENCFARSGIGDAAKAAGAEVVLPHARYMKQADLKGGTLGVWPVLEPFLEATKVINIPIAKHHSLTGVTLGMKNWYGIIGGNRSRLHQRIHESIVDLAAFARPTLTVMDATRVLIRNGPTGGGTENVEQRDTLIVSTDQVAVDAYTAKAWWNLDVPRLRFLRLAQERGLGRADFASLRTHVLQV